MTMDNRAYNLLVNEQSALRSILEEMGIENINSKIAKILDKDQYEVLECSEHEILKIKKKSTNEVFEKGGKFYHIKYKKWVENVIFDEFLNGCWCMGTYYKNYVRADCGIYMLNEISSVEIDVQQEISLNGYKYVLKND